MNHNGNMNMLWATLLIEEVTRLGIKCFVIAPGSRSAPLAVAAWRNPSVKTRVHYDERGAAFFALGAARAGVPAAVICTSGTAVANCFPAVAEANLSGLPLVILSADRPPEMHQCGANQTMEQAGLFGSHVRASLSLPCPDAGIPAGLFLSRIDQALSHCFAQAPGPVHINCPFREPLAPVPVPASGQEDYLDELKEWHAGTVPWCDHADSDKKPDPEEIRAVLESFAGKKNKALLLGAMHRQEDQEMACRLAKRLGWRVLPDILSNCRRNETGLSFLSGYDLLAKAGCLGHFFQADAILHLGDTFVSKALYEFLQASPPELYVHVHPRSDRRDPAHLVTRHLQGSIAFVCRSILNMPEIDRLRAEAETLPTEGLFSRAVENLNDLTDTAPLTELSLSLLLHERITESTAFFSGNSMPIRYMDMLDQPCCAFLIHANRGVSGIDGNIATAAGIAFGCERPTVACIGDMTALHDLNSLALVAASPTPVILVIVNNGGGGIFHHLPIAAFPEVLVPCFVHPHRREFSGAAAMFGLPWYAPETVGAFKTCWSAVQDAGESCIIECKVDKEISLQAYSRMIDGIRKEYAPGETIAES